MSNKWENVDNFETLKTKVNNIVGTDWVELPIQLGFTTTGSLPMYKKKDDIVYLRGNINSVSGDFGSGVLVAVLPENFRPYQLHQAHALFYGDAGNVTGLFNITDDGELKTYHETYSNMSLDGISFSTI